LHPRCCVIQNHRPFVDSSRVAYWDQSLAEGRQFAPLERRPTYERKGTFGRCATKGTKHGPVEFGLGSRNRRIGVAHERGGYHAAFEHDLRLYAEECGAPDTEVGELSNLDRADVGRNSVSNRGIDGVFSYVASRPEIVVFAPLGGKAPKLLLHLVGSLPRP